MKSKIINEQFIENKGISIVTIQNRYGHFTGKAFCNKEDYFSVYQGERIAATRANIKFAKSKLKEEKAKLKAINNLLKNLLFDEYFNFNIYEEKTYKRAKKEQKRYCKNINNWENIIIALEDSIKKMDEERQKVLSRSNKNK